MKKTNNEVFIRRMLYTSKIILIGICIVVGSMAISDGPATVPNAQVDDPYARIVLHRINDPQQSQPDVLHQDKTNKRYLRQNVKPESKELRKNNSEPLGDFLGLCVLGVGVLMVAAFLVLLYGAVDATSAGGLLVGAAFAGILFILIFIKLIKLGKKLGKKPKDKSSVSNRNKVKTNEEAFVMNGQMRD